MYSISMSLVDFIPVILFGISIFILQRDLYNKMSKGCYALFCAGTIDVFMAGILKALYKLLYAANICDFEKLNAIFFPLQALGFLMAGFALCCMVFLKQNEKALAVAPVIYSGTMIFVSLMVLGLLGMNISLSIVASKMKKKKLIICFVICMIFSLMMGYLSSKDFSQSYMNWAAECVNIIGQLALFIGVKSLDKAGLNEYKIER